MDKEAAKAFKDPETAEAFEDPKPGYRFAEMYSFWCLVIDVSPYGPIVTAEGNGQIGFELKVYKSVEDLQKRFKYSGSNENYWVSLVDKRNNPNDFLKVEFKPTSEGE